MIEIKISLETAVNLLTDRMNLEMKLRKQSGVIPKAYSFSNLTFGEMTEIVETSLFDMIFLLPYDLLLEENNLADIITQAVRALATEYNRVEFNIYSRKSSQLLINKIRMFLRKNNKKEIFENN